MSLILYVHSVFGILFVIRTLQIFRRRSLLTNHHVTIFGTIFVCATLIVSFFGLSSPFLAIAIQYLCVFVITGTIFLFERQQIDALKAEFPIFLDRWILNTRIGIAPSTARDSALREQSEAFHGLLRPFFAAQWAPGQERQHQLLSGMVLNELQSIQKEPHTTLERLENLRAHLRQISEFRRKSGQAVRQTSIQATVMVILVLALTTATVCRYGWSNTKDVVGAALFLTSLGLATMYSLARKTKWMI